ncbi:MAG: biopolymer transporter ExbD [Chitinophagales bacterium]|nr:biopolymer transporter ExbD [Bacteroidota bacterium]MCB9226110.1 biopolymer transporter ExbD [Chitinophagales bacterium]
MKKLQVNAASMADIAFLLLIFFMMTTTIQQDQGILSKLPENIPPEEVPLKKRNVVMITMNNTDKILLDNEEVSSMDEFKEICKKHIMNNNMDKSFSENPKVAVFLIKVSRGTAYTNYIEMNSKLKEAYKECRNEFALNLTKGKYNYTQLVDKAKNDTTFMAIKEQVQYEIPYLVQEDYSIASN